MLSQGRYWRASLAKGGGAVVLNLLRDALPDDLRELADLRIEVPLPTWQRVVKLLRGDRKLLGGVLLDYARSDEALVASLASDRLHGELLRVVQDATTALVEEEILTLVPAGTEDD